ncbi:uncharacterized protein LOC107365769 [Tetranychus urticae]|uniref:Uncharacterized protein n=1 Tax=Tetranychus urticae TaxID=32264 RepID=T1KNV0_TETUR|nr:uncharacterized protein LOC107365769 [Tetranychus urticae]
MTVNNDTSSKITIKVRLSDEDYQDITIDWSDESCEHKQQILIRKIASFIGLPIQYIRVVDIYPTTNHISLSNTESHFHTLYVTIPPPRVNETFWQRINDGDCFYLRSSLFLLDHEHPLDLYVDLFSAEREDIHPTECSEFYCQIKNSRSWLDKKKEIILNSEIFPKVRAITSEVRWTNVWFNTLVDCNILQYFGACCHRYLTNTTKHRRLYFPHRG